jgi:hypothetical protein
MLLRSGGGHFRAGLAATVLARSYTLTLARLNSVSSGHFSCVPAEIDRRASSREGKFRRPPPGRFVGVNVRVDPRTTVMIDRYPAIQRSALQFGRVPTRVMSAGILIGQRESHPHIHCGSQGLACLFRRQKFEGLGESLCRLVKLCETG